ncbi:MAG: NADPH-dependent glutamate synthase [Candidatus Bathyarchaeia archaeon]|nr:NADPH-dependent glutamate synthase [Candidatus Bathyarchaeota archaeon]
MQKLEFRLKQVRMPELPIDERLKTFDEVALGYSEEQALAEAARCLQCTRPLCVEMCPLHVDIPEFIKLVRLGDYEEAAEKIRQKNCMPSVCGRVCPQEALCVMGCKNTIGDPINIGALERFVADWELETGATVPEIAPSTGKSVAVVGSGPAGLSVATELARRGHHVVVFEALHEPGGVLIYGIPEFRLPKKVVKKEIDYVKKLGVEIKTNVIVGKTLTIDDLFDEGFNAVFLGTGAGLPKLLGIPGENLCGVYSLNEFLLRINLMKAGLFPHKSKTPIKVRGRVAILGARGMDAARSALRLGAEEACIFYQRKVVGRADDVRRGLEEGVKMQPSTKPIRLIGDEKRWVKLVELIKLKPGQPDRTGKPKLIPESGSEFLYSAETVIVATEHIPNTIAAANTTRSIKIAEKNKTIIVNQETLEAANGIFAGGDVVSGAASVIKAIEAGKRAAQSINTYISKH